MPFASLRARAATPLAVLAALVPASAALAQSPVPIADAKALAIGTVVTVAGRVTVAAEFGGPAYFQDATGGMPVFFNALHAAVQPGDSVVVTGPLSEFGATTGQVGTGLKQLSCPTGNTTCITFTVVATPRVLAAPRIVALSDLVRTPADPAYGEALEGQLVTVDGVRFATTGSFQANTSVDLTDGTTTVKVYIDNTTNLVGAAIPTGTFRIAGVIGQNRGTRQIQPRTTADVGATAFVYPFEATPRSRTFEVVTWNLEFFGYDGPIGTDPDAGPNDEELQIANAVTVLRRLDADLYGLQEIVSTAALRRVVDSLNVGRPGTFRGFVAPIRQIAAGEDPAERGQKTAYIYRDATVDSVSTAFTTTSGWAFCCGSGGGGRYPYAFTFDARIEGATRRITAIVIHAKAGASVSDYDQRTADFAGLKAWMDARPNDAIVLLGDYNDDVDVSIVGGRASTYAPLVNESAAYRVVTKSLSDRRFQSTGGGQVIDHIAVTNELFAQHLAGTERVENPSYVGSYTSTTSDHYPVWTRFDLAGVTTSAEAPPVRAGGLLGRVYPVPARTRLVVETATEGAAVTLHDVLGRTVARFETTASGTSSVDVSGLAPGVYVVRAVVAGRTEARTVVVAR